MGSKGGTKPFNSPFTSLKNAPAPPSPSPLATRPYILPNSQLSVNPSIQFSQAASYPTSHIPESPDPRISISRLFPHSSPFPPSYIFLSRQRKRLEKKEKKKASPVPFPPWSVLCVGKGRGEQIYPYFICPPY